MASVEREWIFPRDGQRVYAWAPDPDKPAARRQKRLPADLKTDAAAWAYVRQHRDELRAGAPVAKRAACMSWVEIGERWKKLRGLDGDGSARLAASTVKDAASHMKKWILPMLATMGIATPASLDVPAARSFVRALSVAKVESPKRKRVETIAPYTVRNVVATLAWVLDDAEGEGWIKLPWANVARAKAVRKEMPAMAPRVGRSQTLRVAEVALAQRLLDCAKVPLDWRARYALAFTSGARDGEISALLVRDIDHDGGVFQITKALQLKTRGKGTGVGKAKTADSVRQMPLHPAASAAVRSWLATGWPAITGRQPDGGDVVLISPQGRPWRPRSAEAFREHAALAGLPTEIDGHPLTFHALRRSFASWLAAADVPKEARDRLMGHVPRSTGERHYTESDMRLLKGYVERIGLIWRCG